jgi:hypothetical protein
MRFLRQVIVQNETFAVSTQRTDDLPVNPLTMILVTLRVLEDLGTTANFSSLNAVLNQIAKLEVLYKGSAIISGSLADIARMNGILLKHIPMQTKTSIVDNDARTVTVPILLGRRPYDPAECFPAVRRGELQLQMTTAAAQTGIDTPVVQVETVELLDATPTRFLKATTISRTFPATGDNDVDVPIGNKIAGILLFGTTAPTGAVVTATLGQLRLLVDNVESYYARTNWETLHNELQRYITESPAGGAFTAEEHGAAANAVGQFLATGEHAQTGFYDNYAFLDFDPLKDDSYLLDTLGRARIHLRITAGVANAMRMMPLEIIDVQQAISS